MASQQARFSPSKRLLDKLNAFTPMAEVLQHFVASFLAGPSTLFVVDSNCVRAVDLTTRAVHTVAGSVTEQEHVDGQGANAGFRTMYALAAARGAVFVGDLCGIRRVTPKGVVSTLAGRANDRDYQQGVGKDATFAMVRGLTANGDSLYCCEDVMTLRRVPLSPVSPTAHVTGQLRQSHRKDGSFDEAQFFYPSAMASDGTGRLFVAEPRAVRMVDLAAQRVTTVAGGDRLGHCDAVGSDARFYGPSGLAWMGNGLLAVTESDNHCVRIVDVTTGSVRTLAGHHNERKYRDGSVERARFMAPSDVVFEPISGDLFVSDPPAQVIRRVSPSGHVSTFAGVHGTRAFVDGPKDVARFKYPTKLALL